MEKPTEITPTSGKNVPAAGLQDSAVSVAAGPQFAREERNLLALFTSSESNGYPRMETFDAATLQQLVKQAQQGVESAQRELIVGYQRRIAGFVYTITGRPETVEDLAQIIFIKMVRALPRLDHPSQFEAWLFRMARNACIDHLRRERWQRFLSPLDSEHHFEIPEPPKDVNVEKLDALRHALDQLKPKDRALIALAQEGYSQLEMASAVGVSLVALKARLHRAREQLRYHYEHAY